MREIRFQSVNSPPEDYTRPTYWSDLVKARHDSDWKKVTVMLLKGVLCGFCIFAGRYDRAVVFPEYYAPDLGDGGVQKLFEDGDRKPRR
jgi:hypothetical protein